MKIHLSLATTNLDASVAFYSILLAVMPAKKRPDYALFIADDPGLELALNFRTSVQPATDAHYGIMVEDADGVERAIARLSKAGLPASIEREETCCYANQTKVWSTDPEGRQWEVYTVHEETAERDDAVASCCASGDAGLSCCTP